MDCSSHSMETLPSCTTYKSMPIYTLLTTVVHKKLIVPVHPIGIFFVRSRSPSSPLSPLHHTNIVLRQPRKENILKEPSLPFHFNTCMIIKINIHSKVDCSRWFWKYDSIVIEVLLPVLHDSINHT